MFWKHYLKWYFILRLLSKILILGDFCIKILLSSCFFFQRLAQFLLLNLSISLTTNTSFEPFKCLTMGAGQAWSRSSSGKSVAFCIVFLTIWVIVNERQLLIVWTLTKERNVMMITMYRCGTICPVKYDYLFIEKYNFFNDFKAITYTYFSAL